jgi:hypothetical protein
MGIPGELPRYTQIFYSATNPFNVSICTIKVLTAFQTSFGIEQRMYGLKSQFWDCKLSHLAVIVKSLKRPIHVDTHDASFVQCVSPSLVGINWAQVIRFL